MIVVEGPDGGGKSSLCSHLHEVLGLDLSTASQLSKKERNDSKFRSTKAVRERVWQAVFDMVGGADPPRIHDRLFFSELIYSEVLGRQCTFPAEEARHILRLMNACEIPVIFCMPPFVELRKGLAGSDQLEGALENLAAIYNYYVMFARFMSRGRIKGFTNRGQPIDYTYPRCIIYNYTKPTDKQKVTDLVGKYIYKRKLRSGGWYEGEVSSRDPKTGRMLSTL